MQPRSPSPRRPGGKRTRGAAVGVRLPEEPFPALTPRLIPGPKGEGKGELSPRPHPPARSGRMGMGVGLCSPGSAPRRPHHGPRPAPPLLGTVAGYSP